MQGTTQFAMDVIGSSVLADVPPHLVVLTRFFADAIEAEAVASTSANPRMNFLLVCLSALCALSVLIALAVMLVLGGGDFTYSSGWEGQQARQVPDSSPLAHVPLTLCAVDQR
jgi:hypothetical protein